MSRAVPYAADAAGRLVDPATTGQGGPFSCLECHEPVSLRREHLRQGRVVVAHFAHKSGSTCAGESVLHLAAKMRLAHALTYRERPFVIRRVCQRFGCSATHDEPWEPPAFDHAVEEVALGDYRLDVAAMQGQSAVFGFEVYHRHRVGHVKAAELGVPWLELQAEATARDPYVLCPVVDERIVGDDEKDLRCGLQTTRAELPEKVAWRLSEPVLLDRAFQGTRVHSRLVEFIFHSRFENGSNLNEWLCQTCNTQKANQVALRYADIEHQNNQRRIFAQKCQEEKKQRQCDMERALTEQRELFGSDLMHPFKPGSVEFFRQKATTLRFVIRYLDRPVDELVKYFNKNPHLILVAKRCTHCNKPMLFPSGFLHDGNFEINSPSLKNIELSHSGLGYLYVICRYCKHSESELDYYKFKHATVSAHSLIGWLRAFARDDSIVDFV